MWGIDMIVTVSRQGSAAVAAIAGQITHAVCGELQERLMNELRSSDAMVLDCSHVEMLTSAGLRMLLLLHREALGGGKRLVLAVVPEPVQDVMAVTGFWDQFVTRNTLDEAVAHVLRRVS